MSEKNKPYQIYVVKTEKGELVQPTKPNAKSGMKPSSYYSIRLKAPAIENGDGSKSPGDTTIYGRAVLKNQESDLFQMISDSIAGGNFIETKVTITIGNEEVERDAILLKDVKDLGYFEKRLVPAYYLTDPQTGEHRQVLKLNRNTGEYEKRYAQGKKAIFWVSNNSTSEIEYEAWKNRIEFIDADATTEVKDAT